MQVKSIQALRGIAALLVVLFHVSGSSFVSGAAGVDIFFVISGFIMGTVGVRDRPATFLTKRLIRIAPLYWAVTLLMCAGAVAGVFRTFQFDAASLIQSLLFIPYYDPSGRIWPLVVVGWTLNYEMFFYVVFALGLAVARPILVPAIIMVLLVLAGFATKPTLAPLAFWTTPLLLEFTAGLVLSRLVGLRGVALGSSMALAGLGLFVLAAALSLYEGNMRVLGWGVPAFLCVAGLLAVERAGAWPERFLWPLEKLGDASYSLYLWHGLVVALGHRFLGESLAVNLVIIAASIVVAELSYLFFEKPVGRFLTQVFHARSRSRQPASGA